MADEDEIDILGEFSFNSCLAQNNQGIPSCSNREDTVHPQWLKDSITTNWYDAHSSKHRQFYGPSRKLTGNNARQKYSNEAHTTWNQEEKDLLVTEMAKYGRNIRKISQTLKTKTEAEIQALIEAQYGVHLETSAVGMERHVDQEDIPNVAQEEIITAETTTILNMISTGNPTVVVPKPFRKKVVKFQITNKNSLIRPEAINNILHVNPTEILYEDDLVIGSTESIGSELDTTDVILNSFAQQKEKVKAVKKVGNHRRKVSRNFDSKPRNKSKELRSPQGRQRKDSSLSEDGLKSPKMQLVLGSGQALPVSEGEQIIKIEKKKDSEPESDIEIDIDSDSEPHSEVVKPAKNVDQVHEVRQPDNAVPGRNFEPMPKRKKRITLNGSGGYTIMHTSAGDLFERGSEPRTEKPKKQTPQPVHLIQCQVYNADKPAPYEVYMHVSTLLSMDAHGHTSTGEVMGLCGGVTDFQVDGQMTDRPGIVTDYGGVTDRPVRVTVQAYRPAKAASSTTHCDMDPVSQAQASESIHSLGLSVVGWHHSHPTFPVLPSQQDLLSQRQLQSVWSDAPLLAVISSQFCAKGRHASQYRCFRVEDTQTNTPIGYQFSVKLIPDLTEDNLQKYLRELRAILRETAPNEYNVDMTRDICPQTGTTYLEKCISSMRHFMGSAGYEDNDPVVEQLIQGVRDVFR